MNFIFAAVVLQANRLFVIMAAPSAKRARLQYLRDRLSYLSQSALGALLSVAEREGLPSAASRQTIARARDACTQLLTPYGTLHERIPIPTTGGGSLQLEIQNHLVCCTRLPNVALF